MATTLNNKVGTIRTKLAAMLSEQMQNVEVPPEKLNSQIPKLASIVWDCCSWDGWGIDKATKMNVHIYSWNTMSDCVKRGIIVSKIDQAYEIMAKG